MKSAACVTELLLVLPFALVGVSALLALCGGFGAYWLVINTFGRAQRWLDTKINGLFEGIS